MELEEAQLILGLCRQFHCLPSELEKEDARLLRLLAIEQRGTKQQDPENDHYESGEEY